MIFGALVLPACRGRRTELEKGTRSQLSSSGKIHFKSSRDMELSDLASKQKRVQHWTAFVGSEVMPEELKARFIEALKCYKNLLAKVWQQSSISDDDVRHFEDLERRLQELDWNVRLRG